MSDATKQQGPKKKPAGGWVKKAAIGGASLALTYAATAIALVYWPDDGFKGAPVVTAKMQAMGDKASGVNREQVYPFAELLFTARDGERLFARGFGGPARTTVVLMHGVASDSAPMNAFAGMLNAASGARVIAYDHRGHGKSGGKVWQVEHAGQYEEDAADIVAAIRKESPGGRIVIAGHSMGGGIALRYALDPSSPQVDGYLLMAPLLGGDAPSMRKAGTPEEQKIGEMFVKFRTARLIGTVMLDSVGVGAFNNEPILMFNRPGMPAYGYNALQSMQPNAPQDYRAALQAIGQPLLLVAGSKDEAFDAAGYESVMAQYGKGKAALIAGATHNGVTHDPRTIERVSEWLGAMDVSLIAEQTSTANRE